MSPFIHTCQCTRGFFTLRPCGAAAPQQCGACQRFVCGEHSASPPPQVVCAECWARAQEDRALDDDESGWFYQSRARYYATYGYQPIYWGDDRYDRYDARSFDRPPGDGEVADDAAADQDAAAGLGDS